MSATKLRLALHLSSIRRRFPSDAVTDVSALDALVTQDNNFIVLNQSPNDVLLINQDFESQGDIFLTQDGRVLQTQDNRTILTQRES